MFLRPARIALMIAGLFGTTASYAVQTPSQVQTLVNNTITSNGTGAITGPILNSALTAMIKLVPATPSANGLFGYDGSGNPIALGYGATIHIAQVNLSGSSTGYTALVTNNSGVGNYTLTMPAVSDTVAVVGTAQTWTAPQVFNSTTQPTLTGHEVGIAGTFTFSSPFSATGQGFVYTNTFSGLTVSGQGSFLDASQRNSAGALAEGVLTGTQNVLFYGNVDIMGSSTGYTTLTTNNAGSSNYTITVPAVTDTLMTLGQAQSVIGQLTLASPIWTGTLAHSGNVSGTGIFAANPFGAWADLAAGNITDTGSTGTVAQSSAFFFHTPTLLASNATVITNAATLTINSAPTCSTNVTCTNTHALWVKSGHIELDGNVAVGSGSVQWSGNIGGANYFGTTAVGFDADFAANSNNDTASSGTVGEGANVYFHIPTFTATSATTITAAANVIIASAPTCSTNVTCTNRYALWIKSGLTEIDGTATLSNTAILLTGIGSDTGKTTRTVCQQTSNAGLYYGSGTGGICAGTSGEQFKNHVFDEDAALEYAALAIPQKRYHFNPGLGYDPAREFHAFTAQSVLPFAPDCVGKDPSGIPNSVDDLCVVHLIIGGLKLEVADLWAVNDNLRREVAELKRKAI